MENNKPETKSTQENSSTPELNNNDLANKIYPSKDNKFTIEESIKDEDGTYFSKKESGSKFNKLLFWIFIASMVFAAPLINLIILN